MSDIADDSSLRHPRLRGIARAAVSLPGAQPVLREMVVRLLHSPTVPLRRRQQVFNLLHAELAPPNPATFVLGVEAGQTIQMRYDPIDDLSLLLYFWGMAGVHDPGVAEVVRYYAREGSVVIDVGANIGLYTLLAAAHVGKSGRVHAFEPSPMVFRDLRRNVDLNAFKNVVLNEMALSDFNGSIELHVPRDPRARTNASVVPGYWESDRTVEVPVQTPDMYCSLAGIERVDVLKVDAEGGDAKVLTGSIEILRRDRPIVLCEVLAQYADGIYEVLDPLGYNAYLITERGPLPTDKVMPDPVYRDYLFVPDDAPVPARC